MSRFPIALAALLTVAASPAAAQPQPLLSPAEALAQDAADYARRHGVGSDEALRRLRAQQGSIEETARIERVHAARIAGVSIRHGPDFHLRVLLTGDAPVPDETIEAGGTSLPVRYITGARATRSAVIAALRRDQAAIRVLIPGEDGMGFDPATGMLTIMADPRDLRGEAREAVEGRIAALTGVPVRIRILTGEDRDASAVLGGGRVEGPGEGGRTFFCTTGFVVTDGPRTGILTAAHCPDDLIYKAPDGTIVPLDYLGGWGERFHDVQVHVTPGDAKPVFHADRAAGIARPLTGARRRATIRGGETVCHQGESTGYSCAEIDLTDYAPPRALCGGACTPFWVTVAGPSCRGGDSGGPVFLGTIGLGILKGSSFAPDGRCNFYYFMSTDFMPPGWFLLLAPAPAQAPQSSSSS